MGGEDINMYGVLTCDMWRRHSYVGEDIHMWKVLTYEGMLSPVGGAHLWGLFMCGRHSCMERACSYDGHSYVGDQATKVLMYGEVLSPMGGAHVWRGHSQVVGIHVWRGHSYLTGTHVWRE